MEDTGALFLAETVIFLSSEFKKIGHGRERATERDHKGYSSAADFRQQK